MSTGGFNLARRDGSDRLVRCATGNKVKSKCVSCAWCTVGSPNMILTVSGFWRECSDCGDAEEGWTATPLVPDGTYVATLRRYKTGEQGYSGPTLMTKQWENVACLGDCAQKCVWAAPLGHVEHYCRYWYFGNGCWYHQTMTGTAYLIVGLSATAYYAEGWWRAKFEFKACVGWWRTWVDTSEGIPPGCGTGTSTQLAWLLMTIDAPRVTVLDIPYAPLAGHPTAPPIPALYPCHTTNATLVWPTFEEGCDVSCLYGWTLRGGTMNVIAA